jgi:hypothetical protein
MLIKEKLLFSKEECKTILSYNNLNIKNWNTADRKYNSQAIDYSVKTSWLFDKLKTFFETELDIKIIKMKNQIHFHKFEMGNWFDKHNDDRNNRLYAVGVLLNDEFEGGDFKLYNPNEYTLNKQIGNTYIFDVRIGHEITPILKGERYSLLWFLENEHVKIETTRLI